MIAHSPADVVATLTRETLAIPFASIARISMLVERTEDDAFKVTASVNPPAGSTQTAPGAPRSQMVQLMVDRAGLLAIIPWCKERYVTINASFARWAPWRANTIEANARELARVFDAKPMELKVCRSTPTSERGEPPMGQPSIVITLDANGVAIESYLVLVYTDESDHAKISADIVASGEALARALEVPVKVLG